MDIVPANTYAAPEELAENNLPILPQTRLLHLKSYPGVWLKCEHENPTGSHKDRAYLAMLGAIGGPFRERTFVDYTTGNGGISLAWLAGQVGAHAVVFMPEGMTSQRSELIRSYGAELILTPSEGFVAAARAAAETYAQEHPDTILLSQSDNLANEGAFFEVGLEIVEQFHMAHIKPAAFACAIGTGATFSGIAAALKWKYSDMVAIGIEVPEAPIIWAKRRGETVTPRTPSIVGMGAGKIARNTDERLIDRIEVIGLDDIAGICDSIFSIDNLDIGPSSAANILVASRLVSRLGCEVVTVSFDRGDRYDAPPPMSSATVKSRRKESWRTKLLKGLSGSESLRRISQFCSKPCGTINEIQVTSLRLSPSHGSVKHNIIDFSDSWEHFFLNFVSKRASFFLPSPHPWGVQP